MKKTDNFIVYAWLEFIIWLVIIALCVFGIRYHHYKTQQNFKSYQIFMNDADGLIVGSPVRFLGIQIGHVTKIQIVSSDVYSDIYIKFVVNDKNLTLPTGAIATVEGTGLGGSKSLEIYPPDYNDEKDKIIVSKDSTRLNKVLSLFNAMFKNIEEIFTNLNHTGKELSKTPQLEAPRHNEVTPASMNENLENLNEKLDEIINKEQKLRKQLDKIKKKKSL